MPFDWATFGASVGISVVGSGLIVGLLGWWLDRRRFRHQQTMDTWKQRQQSYDREIDYLEKVGNAEAANQLRTEAADQERAWRAQQGVTALAPRQVRAEGGTSLTEGELGELRRLLADSAGLNPGALSPDDHFQRANAYYETGQYREALAAYNRALALRPDYPEALNNRGNALWYLGRNTDALVDYNRALALRPDHPDTLNNRGNALQNFRRYSEALDDYNRALELHPDRPDTLNNRGNALLNLIRYREALDDYNRALELRPDHSTTLSNRGAALAYLGRYDEALTDYNRALELRPDHPNTLYNMACLFSRKEEYEHALGWLRRAIGADAKYRLIAAEDPAFAPLREHPQFGPQFRQLVG